MSDSTAFPLCKDTDDAAFVSDETYAAAPDAAMHSTQEKLMEEIVEASGDVPIDQVALEATVLQLTEEFGCVTSDGRFAVDASRFSMKAFEARYSANMGAAARLGVGEGGAAVLAIEARGDLTSMATTSEGTFGGLMRDIQQLEAALESSVKQNELMGTLGYAGVGLVAGEALTHYSQTWQDVPLKDAASHSALVEQRQIETSKWEKVKKSDAAMDCLQASGVPIPEKPWSNMPSFRDPGLRFRDSAAILLIQNRRWVFTGMGLIAGAGILMSADGGDLIVEDYLVLYDKEQQGSTPSPSQPGASTIVIGENTNAGEVAIESDASRVATVSVAGATRNTRALETELANFMIETWSDITTSVSENKILEAEEAYIDYLLYARNFCEQNDLDFEVFKGAKMARLIQRLKASSWSNTLRTTGVGFMSDHPLVTAAAVALGYTGYKEFSGAFSGEFVMDAHADEYRGPGRSVVDARNINRIEREKNHAYLDLLRGAGQCKEVYDEEYAKLDEREKTGYREHAGLPEPTVQSNPALATHRPPAPALVGAPAPTADEDDAAPAGVPAATRHAMVAPDFAIDVGAHDYVYGYMPVEDLGELARGVQTTVDGRVRVAVDYTNRVVRVMDQGTWELVMARSAASGDGTTIKPFSWENFKGTGRGSGTMRTGSGPQSSGVGSAASFAGGVFVYSAVGVLLGVAVEKSGLSEVQKMGVMYTYTGMGVVMTAQAVKANPQLLHLVAPAWVGVEAGGLLTDMILDAAGVEDSTIRQVAGGVGSATGAGVGTYAGLRMLARGSAKTPVTLVFAAGAMAISAVADQRELDKIKASFLAANPSPLVAAEFQYVCDVIQLICQGPLGYGTKVLEQFTDEDLKMLRWLLGEDAFGDGKLSTPLTQEIVKAMGGWFVREYFPDLERGMGDLMVEDHMTADEIAVRRANAAALTEIKLCYENPGYSTHQYESLCSQLDTLLADWNPTNLKKIHTLLYDPSYKAVLTIHGADIALNYLEPFMEAQFGFKNTSYDIAEEWLQDWVRDDSEIAALQQHRDMYGSWMLALYRHVQDPNYQTIVPLPKDTDRHVATQSVAPRDDISYVSLRAPDGRGNPSGMTTVTSPRAPTAIERQQAEAAYAELKKKPPIQGPQGYWDGYYAASYWERQITGDQKPWYDESFLVTLTTKMESLHKADQVIVAGELCKLWIQDVRTNLDDEWGLSDFDLGEALRLLQALEEKVKRYQSTGSICYVNWFKASKTEKEKFLAETMVGERGEIKFDIDQIVRFVDEA